MLSRSDREVNRYRWSEKPTWEAAQEAEAQNDPTKKAHTGGVRFEKGSPEYQTLLDWINGARSPSPAQCAGR
jgi:hypothetical protein